jgi:hypothetical protein
MCHYACQETGLSCIAFVLEAMTRYAMEIVLVTDIKPGIQKTSQGKVV